jgi:hypothetical protein
VIPITVITGAVFYRLVYLPLMVAVYNFWHTSFLLPMNLIRKNGLMDHYFKRLAASAKTRFSFF